ncbi:dynamin family protein [Pseudoalteromonas sp. SA25]|uniref:dynamin family protein n=1 Tax=Pseudoalteromonas sp. SA25 TaxID=2686347 RepID=UPI0013FE0D1F|nr:dynamin family protein [Pseudoalteromonas sp. SA25]
MTKRINRLEELINTYHQGQIESLSFVQDEVKDLNDACNTIDLNKNIIERFKLIFNQSSQIELKETLLSLQDKLDSGLQSHQELLSSGYEALQEEFHFINTKVSDLEDEVENLNSVSKQLKIENGTLKELNTTQNNAIELLKLDIKQLTAEFKKEVSVLEDKNTELYLTHDKLKNEHTELQRSNTTHFNEIQSLKLNAKKLNIELDTLSINLDKLKVKFNELEAENLNLKSHIKSLELESRRLNIDIKVSSEQYTKLEEQFNELEKSHTLTETRESLIGALLSARNSNQNVTKFHDLLHGEFMMFANNEGALINEAEIFYKLQELESELHAISTYPELHNKRVVSIGGGFSSGKSEFISSLFKNEQLKLPIGINPTTAIPTYVFDGKETGVLGLSKTGGVVDLLLIDPDMHHKLSHEFICSFGFNLKEIMPSVFLRSKMAYKNICFIDTPGYNPLGSVDGYQHEDVNTAREYIDNANALIWLIGADSNGTIPRSDLLFLENFKEQSGKQLYIILNKADVKPIEEIEEIIDEIEETLDDYDIDFLGISAYSSIQRKEYIFKKQPLAKFLKTQNSASDKHNEIIQRLSSIAKEYEVAISNDMKNQNNVAILLKGIRLDLLASNLDEEAPSLYKGVVEKSEEIKAIVSKKSSHKKQLQELEKVIEKMMSAIDTVFEKKITRRRKDYTKASHKDREWWLVKSSSTWRKLKKRN